MRPSLVVDLGPLAGQLAGDQVGLADLGLGVEGVERLAQRLDVDQGRLDAGDQLGPLVVDVLAAGGPAGGGLLDGLEGVGGLGLGVLGGPQLVPAISSSRRSDVSSSSAASR